MHDPGQVRQVRRAAETEGGYLDRDTPVSPESYTVALAAAGACASAVDAVIQGKGRNALCLVRPPGHHATPTRSMGFCLFNNVALAAQPRRTAHGLNRVLIVDWDVHHGNGTQDIFYADPEVTVPQHPPLRPGFYPGTGAADETGTGPGLGRTLNVPMRFGISPHGLSRRLHAALEKAADAIKPELVLVSAGFDAHAADPIGSLGSGSRGFRGADEAGDGRGADARGRPAGELPGGRLQPRGAGRVGAGASGGVAGGRNLRIGFTRNDVAGGITLRMPKLFGNS